MRATRRFTVRPRLPEPLAPLGRLVMNLRWTWRPEVISLFERVDPELWARCEGDPVRLLGSVGVVRLDELARDAGFVSALERAVEDLERELRSDRWYQELAGAKPSAIGYFSMEYGLSAVLPQYSGGLGILAGDHLKAASNLGVPVVGVGLLYRRGYFRQALSEDGWQVERYPAMDPAGLPISRVAAEDGEPLVVRVALPGERTLHAAVWTVEVGRVPLLLLDSDLEENDDDLRSVTDRLYGGGSEHRLRQEMLLGIGGVRAAEAYAALSGQDPPEVFHCNEGHAGFLWMARAGSLVAPPPEGEGLDFDEALCVVRAGTVFTTHTPVDAGIDRFPVSLVESHLRPEAERLGLPLERILALGAEADPSVFNMAHMGLRVAQRSNGVSRLHGRVSREMFRGLWPGFEPDDVPIGSVTNGVHGPTWTAPEVLALSPDSGDEELWAVRTGLRRRLVAEVRRRLEASWRTRGAVPASLGWIAEAFDPEILTIGFARRVPAYKRLTLMLRDPERLERLLLDPDRPLQIVVAGKAHPADEAGKALVQQMVRFADRSEVRHRIAFLPDYDMAMAKALYAGCDVWLNNPLRPLEACGTSGMKSALNGGLNLSVRDGWWDELADGRNGWVVPSADVADAELRDDLEAAALYDLLEGPVRSRFYERGRDGVPHHWVSMIRHTLSTLGPRLQATRMVEEYVTGYYVPAARSLRELCADGCSGARELAAWSRKARDAWSSVRVAHVQSSTGDQVPLLGGEVAIRAVVDLDGLDESEVDVEVVYGPVDDLDEVDAHGVVHLELREDGEGAERAYEGVVPLTTPGSFGYAVRVLPRHRLFASPAELGLVARADPDGPDPDDNGTPRG